MGLVIPQRKGIMKDKRKEAVLRAIIYTDLFLLEEPRRERLYTLFTFSYATGGQVVFYRR
jgi:hypothetical protein